MIQDDEQIVMDCKVTNIIRRIPINQRCDAIYSTLHKISLAVHETLHKDFLESSNIKYKWDYDNIRLEYSQHTPADLSDSQFFAKLSDYYGVYEERYHDRGHLAPWFYYRGGDSKMRIGTNSLVNLVPQQSFFNRIEWFYLQDTIHKLSSLEGFIKMEVITGPVFYSQLQQHEGNNRNDIYNNDQKVFQNYGIIIPSHLFKVVKLFFQKSHLDISFAFCLPNNDDDHPDNYKGSYTLRKYQKPIQELQRMTGLRFNFVENNTEYKKSRQKNMLQKLFNTRLSSIYFKYYWGKKFNQKEGNEKNYYEPKFHLTQQQKRRFKKHLIQTFDQSMESIKQETSFIKMLQKYLKYHLLYHELNFEEPFIIKADSHIKAGIQSILPSMRSCTFGQVVEFDEIIKQIKNKSWCQEERRQQYEYPLHQLLLKQLQSNKNKLSNNSQIHKLLPMPKSKQSMQGKTKHIQKQPLTTKNQKYKIQLMKLKREMTRTQ